MNFGEALIKIKNEIVLYENDFEQNLNDLLDTAHSNTINIIKIEED